MKLKTFRMHVKKYFKGGRILLGNKNVFIAGKLTREHMVRFRLKFICEIKRTVVRQKNKCMNCVRFFVKIKTLSKTINSKKIY